MIITAKYNSTCPKCGRYIDAGEKVEWRPGTKATHIECNEADSTKPVAKSNGKSAKPKTEQGPYKVSRGQGYGGQPYRVGAVVRNTATQVAKGEPLWLTVLTTSQEYVREDGLSFGVGDESGYIYYASARAATPEEVATVEQELLTAKARKMARMELDKLHGHILSTGKTPEGRQTLKGEIIEVKPRDIYGGGYWFVLEDEWIWAVRNNGRDGDDWGQNNVTTGGAGAIGRRIPRDQETETKIRQLILTIK